MESLIGNLFDWLASRWNDSLVIYLTDWLVCWSVLSQSPSLGLVRTTSPMVTLHYCVFAGSLTLGGLSTWSQRAMAGNWLLTPIIFIAWMLLLIFTIRAYQIYHFSGTHPQQVSITCSLMILLPALLRTARYPLGYRFTMTDVITYLKPVRFFTSS